jgi:hypothetical protein
MVHLNYPCRFLYLTLIPIICQSLRIVAWNIHGRLAVRITQPQIVRLINDNDVIVFQETFLRIGEERTLELPPSFEIIEMISLASDAPAAGLQPSFAWGLPD